MTEERRSSTSLKRLSYYQEDALGSQLCYRDGRGKEKRVSPEKLLLQSSLLKERPIPTGDRVQRVRSVDNQQLRNFTSCPSAPHSHKSFLFLEAQEGEQCSITVPAGSEPLTWLFNNKVIYRGTHSCCQFAAGLDTAGVYLCLAKCRDTLLLTCIVQLKSCDITGSIVRQRPLGNDRLLLSTNIADLSEAYSDDPVRLCGDCRLRETVFRSPRRCQNLQYELGDNVVLVVEICQCARDSFCITWTQNGYSIPFETQCIYEFQMRAASEGTYLCLASYQNKPVFNSQAFIIDMVTQVAVSESTVCEETTPAQYSATSLPPSSPLLESCALEPRHHGTEEFVVTQRQHQLCLPVPHLPNEKPPIPDTEPEPKPEESEVVSRFLTSELEPCVTEPKFNLPALSRTPSCRSSVRDIIQDVQSCLQFDPEEEFLGMFIRYICCETTPDLIGIRRCEALCYDLIISLESDQDNTFHCAQGRGMRYRAPLKPYILEWKPGRSLCLPRGEFVAFQVKAYNADSYKWVHDRVVVSQDPHYFIRVAPETCGTYQCWVSNRHGTVQTPLVDIDMIDDRTSSAKTAAVCKAIFETSLPSHELHRAAPTEATPSSQTQCSVMAVSRACSSEQVVPVSHRSVHHGVDKAAFLHHFRGDEPRFKHPPNQGSPGYTPAVKQPPNRSNAAYVPYQSPATSWHH